MRLSIKTISSSYSEIPRSLGRGCLLLPRSVLMVEKPAQAFLSYARSDDSFLNGGITWLCEELHLGMRALTLSITHKFSTQCYSELDIGESG